MNTYQLKIQKISKIVSVITKIAYISLIVAICLELVGLAWIWVSPNSNSFDLGGITVASPILDEGATNNEIVAQLTANIVSQAFLLAILLNTFRIFKDISKEDSPFALKHVKRIKRISLLMLISALVVPSIEMATYKILAPTLETSSLFDSSSIVFVLVFYCLALIFEYGAQLQIQSDETL